jgi:UDP-glucose 4-epimerase
MRILISGTRGFIGSVLMTRAKEAGHFAYGLDDYSRGLNDTATKKWDCRQGVKEIFDEFTVNVNEPPFDAVVHLAAGTGSLSRPYEELCELNIDMTKKIYLESVEAGIPVFAFPTTSLVEGVPDSPYVRSKQDAMDWLLSKNDNINKIPLQFYNVTGAYNDFSEIRKLEVHIVPIMIECFMNNKPFIINGDKYDTVDGTPGRDFSNVIDVSDFILHLCRVQLERPFKSGGVIKVGTGQITTALQMVEMFNEIVVPRFGRKLEYEIGPERAYDCGWLRCDQPYLSIVKKPILIKQSLRSEVDTILRKVYNA